MAWIESHQKLERDPKLLDLIDLLSLDTNTAIGMLHRFWWWCVDHAEDGDLRSFNDGQLARIVEWNGEAKVFVEAMVTAGFFERKPYFRVGKWWKFIGRYLQAKYKSTPNLWKKVYNLYVEVTSPEQISYFTPQELQDLPDITKPKTCDPPLSGEGLNGSHLGKGKKKKAKSKPAPLYLPEWVDQFWDAYPNPAWRPNLNAAFEALNPDADLFRKIMDGLEVAKISEEWARDNGKWIPHPAKFVSGRGWENKYTVKTKGGPLL